MNNLPENYFQTHGLVTLPGIEEAIKLPRAVWFRYDGAVPSIVDNIARTELIIKGFIDPDRTRIQRVLDWPLDKVQMMGARLSVQEKLPSLDELNAYCYAHKIPGKLVRAYVIGKKQGLDLSKSLFADGHESGEFLDEIGQTRVLQEALDKENISLKVSDYKNEELADIGGLLAELKAARAGAKDIIIPTFRTRPAVRPEQVKAFGL